MKIALCVLTGVFASIAAAAPPPAPAVTAAATDIKQLQFDITPVTQVNRYELWFKANAGASWVNWASTPAQRPRFRINTSVHLLDWTQARYFVKACNPSGCSQSDEVGVDGEQLAAMGYFKPTTAAANQYYGFNFALSTDGTALAVVAGEKIDHVYGRAAIHVYRKTTSTSGWRFEQKIFPSPNNSGASDASGRVLAISNQGDRIVYANRFENDATGAVYVFTRSFDGWHQTQRIAGAGPGDLFGGQVALDFEGNTLYIEHNMQGGVHREGTIEIYRDTSISSNQFNYKSTVPTPAFDDPQWGYCRNFVPTSAREIVRSCFSGANLYYFVQVLTADEIGPLHYTETSRLPVGVGAAIAVDGLGTQIAVQEPQRDNRNYVTVYRRNPTDRNDWVVDGTLDQLGVNDVAMSRDGKIVAVSSTDDTLVGRGPLFPPYQTSSDASGTVAIYERRASGWVLRRYVKAGANHYMHSFGWRVALDDSGKVLAVGSPYDPSTATDIDGDREDASGTSVGAVWLF
jgi:hypothetical protein